MVTTTDIVNFGQQTSPLLRGLNAVAQGAGAIRQGLDRRDKQDMADKRQQAYGLLSQAFDDSSDDAATGQLIEQARTLDPELTLQVQQMISKGKTPSAKIDIENKKLSLRERELDARNLEREINKETNNIRKSKLIASAKREAIKLANDERDQIASEKGGEAQKLLRDASEGAKNAATFANRMFSSNDKLNQLESTIDPTSRVIGIISGGSGISSEVANRIANTGEQEYASAASDFVTAQLRKESGAAIGADEFERKYREFFPVPGDTPDQIKSKMERRALAAADMSIASGGLYDALYEGSGKTVTDTPTVNSQGWGLQVDGSGNKAYVGPNGEIEEVQ